MAGRGEEGGIGFFLSFCRVYAKRLQSAYKTFTKRCKTCAMVGLEPYGCQGPLSLGDLVF